MTNSARSIVAPDLSPHPSSPDGESPAPDNETRASQSAAPAPEEDAFAASASRDIADVSAVEIITTATVHLMSAAAVKIGLAEDEDTGHYQDLAEARKLITALAGLVTAASPEIGGDHARSLRDGLRTLQRLSRKRCRSPTSPVRVPGRNGPGGSADRQLRRSAAAARAVGADDGSAAPPGR